MTSFAAAVQAVTTEEALVEGARALEEDAWASIYERHYRQVYSYAYHRIGDRDTAEDLAAEVFAQAVAGIRSYQYRGRPLLAWLYRIAHNLTSDYLRSRARRLSVSPSEGGGPGAADPELEGISSRQDLERALLTLSPSQQQVVFLRFLQGFSSAEVGAILGKSSETVRALQCRAMRALRRQLSPASPAGGPAASSPPAQTRS
jgi:RNA polymerase sigma-70 factor (ECF subfamily)